jgi:RNA polymerase sigma-70 factor (ECF subfamily)
MTRELSGGFFGWISDLARTHTARLAGVARSEGLSAADALDAVQEAYFALLTLPQARRLVEEPDETNLFLSVLVRNAARNMRRRHHRSRPHEELDESATLEDPGLGPDALVEQAERHVQMLGCVALLKELQQSVVTMRMLAEASHEDVARALGLSAGHVAVLLHRSKEELVRCMASH